MWMMLRAQPRPCFNHELIDEIMTLARAAKDSGLPIDFWVTGSLVPQIYNAQRFDTPLDGLPLTAGDRSPGATENLLAALAAAWSLGLSAASLRTGAETFDPPVPATAAA